MRNKCFRILTSLLLILSLIFSLPVFSMAEAAKQQEEPPAETGRVLQIHNEKQFLLLAENCRLDSYSENLTVELRKDLDLTGMEFSGIPIFCGTFKGNHHSVSGLNLTAGGSNLGFFRYLAPGSLVEDLIIRGTVAPTGSQLNIGGLVGSNAGTVRGCRFAGTLTAEDRVGGIAGTNGLSGIIEDCHTEGDYSASHFLGGIAGENYGVIRNCINRARINTEAQESSVNISSISLETITGTEATSTVTDIGGITGTNVGVVRSCSNHSTVGYPHIGYNVGGITGSHLGYLTGCRNYGEVYGRKEVGGIVGQFEPVSMIAYQEDTLQTLEKQLSGAASLLNRASYNAQSSLGGVGETVAGMREDADRAREAIGLLLGGGFPDPDTVIAARNDLMQSMQAMQGAMHSVGMQAGEAAGQLGRDLRAVSSQMGAMGQTIKKAQENMGIRLSDISDEDTEELTDGKLADCINYGPVSGDLNAGGITGAIAFENDMDPEDDLTELGDRSLNLDATLRAVVLRCENQGEITGKKSNIGGIAGWLTMGLIRDCLNTGKINAETAQFVGGIAGSSRGYIRQCYVKCGILADKSAGGIAGSATVVTGCRSMVTIREASEKTGAILGILEPPQEEDIEAPVADNLYMSLSQDLGAIDGISYHEQAEPLAPYRFQKLEDLPQAMQRVTLNFQDAEGRQKGQIVLPMGGILRPEEIPPVPEQEGYRGVWENIEFWSGQRVYFDSTFTPVYTPHRVTVASPQTRANGRPILLAEGSFPDVSEISMEQPPAPEIPDQEILENWKITMHRKNPLILHYSCPSNREAEKLQILVKGQDGAWTVRENTVNARYLVFTLEPEESEFCAAILPDHTKLLYSSAALLAIVGIAALWIAGKHIRKRRKTPVKQAG